MTNPVRQLARELRNAVKPESRALSGKAKATLFGASPVSASCQIEGLREKYAALGLNPRRGQFVEVGAFDGEDYSNTSFLADQGWSGLYVEPVPEFARLARRRHALNRVAIEQVAITREPGQMQINVMGALTSGVVGSVDALKSIEWAKDQAEQSRTITVAADTLAAVLDRHGIAKRFELMVIDIEGAEKQVIDDLLASPWRPGVLIIELVDNHPSFVDMTALQEDHRQIRTALAEANYAEFHADQINSIFRLG
jgi:FkbM family methyltransferase